MDPLTLVIVLLVIAIAAVVLMGRVDPIHALIAVATVLMLWVVMTGGRPLGR